MDRGPKSAGTAQVVLATLAVIAALYLLKPILIPIALALMLACLLSPLTMALRRVLPLGPTGAAVVLFLLTVLLGLYVASLTAEGLVQAANTLPSDIERLSGRVSGQINDMIRDQPYLRAILPEPGTIDLLGDANRTLLIDSLSYGLADLSVRMGQGLIILMLVLFLLAESEMLTPKVIRFFAPTPGDAQAGARAIASLTRQLRAYLVARTLINLGFGGVIAVALWMLHVKFPFALGLFAALTNFIPYVGQLIGGSLPTLIALGQTGSIGDALIVAAVYLAVVGIEGYVVTPYVMGRSLDLNGTTVLIACLFWGFLWGLVGLVLAMPITVSMKLVFQTVPELHRWAELMSRDWQTPAVKATIEELPPAPTPNGPGPPGVGPEVARPRAPAPAGRG
ncbi:MAG TPA: AI-2E family transporter [Isosphaeraceae bacterium]|nr:AI-2E family transporter [Isosphaeraceae bacterium]